MDLEPDRRRLPPAPSQDALDGLEEVLRLVLLDLDVGVPRDAEHLVGQELHAGEESVEVCRDHLLDGNEALPVGHDDEAREQRGNLDAGESPPPSHGIAHDRGEVEREARDIRERMGGVHRQRGQHGEHPLLEDPPEVRPVGVVQIVPRREADVLLLEGRHQLLHERAIHASGEFLHPQADVVELFPRRHPVRRRRADAGGPLLLQAGDADLEELVEILAGDRQELRTLEQGGRRVLGQREHPCFEVEPRELAVDEPGGVADQIRRLEGLDW